MNSQIEVAASSAGGEKPRRRISVRLAIVTLIASTLIALLISGIQTYFTYRYEIAKAQTRFAEVESGFLPSLSNSLWEVNAKGVGQLLDSISQLPGVGKVYLTDETGQVLSRNLQSAAPIGQQDFVLRHVEDNSTTEVGRLHVEIVDAQILLQLKSRALEITLIALIALLGNSFFVLVLFNRWVSRPLVKMARFAADFNPQKIEAPLHVDRPKSSGEDELDLLVHSLNGMQRIIKDELQNRAKIEQELRDHKEHLETLVEERTLAYKYSAEQLAIAASVAELGVWRWNIADNILEWNDRMFAMYSQPLALRDHGLKFEHWVKSLHPDDAEAATSSLMTAIQHSSNYLATFRIVTPAGVVRHIHAKAQIECDTAGKPIMVIGINQDITDQAELESRLTAAKDLADAASAAKSSFLANMSHEIRTPLNAVLGMLQLVQKTKLDERQTDYVGKARSAANSLLSLLNDILDYSKIEAGKMVLEAHPFYVEAWLRELATVLSGNQNDEAVQLFFDIDPLLPHALIADSLRLKQILVNLAGNALKFTQRGHVIVGVKKLAHADGSVWVRFAVTDTGIGIDARQQQFIFEGFNQAEASTSRRFGGTGLGLAICRRLVEQMGAQLRLESELGKGSCFWFDIELSATDNAPLQALIPTIGSGRALLATHSATAAELLAGMLKTMGWQTDLVGNHADAENRIHNAGQHEGSLDLIVLDGRMPDIDALRLARLITRGERGGRQAMIVVAPHATEAMRIHGLSWPQALRVEVITTPMTCIQFAEVIQRVQSKPQLATEHVSSPSQRLAGLRLLVVEDNKLNRDVALGLLTSEGAEVEAAEGGWEGVNRVMDSPRDFDVVIMDMQMPDIDGLEATRMIRAVDRFRDLPILAMTANAAPADRAQCLAAGMNEHIAKPIDIDTVVMAIRKLLEPVLNDLPGESEAKDVVQQTQSDSVIEEPKTILRRFLNNVDLFQRMLAGFQPDQEGLLNELSQQIDRNDAEGARRTLHTIKGAAATMGAKALALYAADLEARLKAGDSSVLISGVVPELKRLLLISARQLESMVDAL